MASEFQHQKVAGVFAAMDTDGDNPAAPGSWVFGFFPAGAGRE
jgi:hypothetical protein